MPPPPVKVPEGLSDTKLQSRSSSSFGRAELAMIAEDLEQKVNQASQELGITFGTPRKPSKPSKLNSVSTETVLKRNHLKRVAALQKQNLQQQAAMSQGNDEFGSIIDLNLGLQLPDMSKIGMKSSKYKSYSSLGLPMAGRGPASSDSGSAHMANPVDTTNVAELARVAELAHAANMADMANQANATLAASQALAAGQAHATDQVHATDTAEQADQADLAGAVHETNPTNTSTMTQAERDLMEFFKLPLDEHDDVFAGPIEVIEGQRIFTSSQTSDVSVPPQRRIAHPTQMNLRVDSGPDAPGSPGSLTQTSTERRQPRSVSAFVRPIDKSWRLRDIDGADLDVDEGSGHSSGFGKAMSNMQALSQEASESLDPQDLYPPSACIFVANLPEPKDDKCLQAAVTREFSQYGTVHVKIRRDAHNMPYAFCQYTRDEHARDAVERGKGAMICGRQCRTEMARSSVNYLVSKRSGDSITANEVLKLMQPFGPLQKVEMMHKQVRQALCLGPTVLVTFARYDARRDLPAAFREDETYRVELFDLRRPHQGGGTTRAAANTDEAFLEQYDVDRRSIYIGGLCPQTSEDNIRAMLINIGPILNLQLIRRDYMMLPRHTNFCFVEFARSDMPDSAIASYHGHILDGYPIRVERKGGRDQTVGAKGMSSASKFGKMRSVTTPMKQVSHNGAPTGPAAQTGYRTNGQHKAPSARASAEFGPNNNHAPAGAQMPAFGTQPAPQPFVDPIGDIPHFMHHPGQTQGLGPSAPAPPVDTPVRGSPWTIGTSHTTHYSPANFPFTPGAQQHLSPQFAAASSDNQPFVGPGYTAGGYHAPSNNGATPYLNVGPSEVGTPHVKRMPALRRAGSNIGSYMARGGQQFSGPGQTSQAPQQAADTHRTPSTSQQGMLSNGFGGGGFPYSQQQAMPGGGAFVEPQYQAMPGGGVFLNQHHHQITPQRAVSTYQPSTYQGGLDDTPQHQSPYDHPGLQNDAYNPYSPVGQNQVQAHHGYQGYLAQPTPQGDQGFQPYQAHHPFGNGFNQAGSVTQSPYPYDPAEYMPVNAHQPRFQSYSQSGRVQTRAMQPQVAQPQAIHTRASVSRLAQVASRLSLSDHAQSVPTSSDDNSSSGPIMATPGHTKATVESAQDSGSD